MKQRNLLACLKAGVLTAVLMAAAAPAAVAGTYTQYTCKLPDGSPAATDGWTTASPASGMTASNTCSSGEALSIGMQRGLATGYQHKWEWAAPANTTLRALNLYRSFELADGDGNATPAVQIGVGEITLDDSGSSLVLSNGVRRKGAAIPWNQAGNWLAASENPGLSANRLSVSLACIGNPGASCPATGTTGNDLYVHGANFTLEDQQAPSVTSAGGSLTTGGSKTGVQSLAIDASDVGSGIYRTILTVDGTPIRTSTPDANEGKCDDAVPADVDPYQFEHRVPCPLSLSGISVPLDTRSLSDGNHIVHVEVEDASGNRTSAFGPAIVEVRNAAAPGAGPVAPSAPGRGGASVPSAVNGQGGGPGARLSVVVVQTNQRAVRLPYGRSVTLSGRLLTASGAPIGNAVVDVLAQTRMRGARLASVGTVRTDAAGGFRYVVRPGPSRLVRFGYRAHTADSTFTHTTDVDVRVKAKVSMRTSHARLRNGRTLRYSGRVFGERSARPLVQIQVRSRGRWVNVCVVRARASGAYSCRYRFRRTFRPTRYTFRALVRSQDGLPYETATSSTVAVRVSP